MSWVRKSVTTPVQREKYNGCTGWRVLSTFYFWTTMAARSVVLATLLSHGAHCYAHRTDGRGLLNKVLTANDRYISHFTRVRIYTVKVRAQYKVVKVMADARLVFLVMSS